MSSVDPLSGFTDEGCFISQILLKNFRNIAITVMTVQYIDNRYHKTSLIIIHKSIMIIRELYNVELSFQIIF